MILISHAGVSLSLSRKDRSWHKQTHTRHPLMTRTDSLIEGALESDGPGGGTVGTRADWVPSIRIPNTPHW